MLLITPVFTLRWHTQNGCCEKDPLSAFCQRSKTIYIFRFTRLYVKSPNKLNAKQNLGKKNQWSGFIITVVLRWLLGNQGNTVWWLHKEVPLRCFTWTKDLKTVCIYYMMSLSHKKPSHSHFNLITNIICSKISAKSVKGMSLTWIFLAVHFSNVQHSTGLPKFRVGIRNLVLQPSTAWRSRSCSFPSHQEKEQFTKRKSGLMRKEWAAVCPLSGVTDSTYNRM